MSASNVGRLGIVLTSGAAALVLASCQSVQPQVTSVGKSVTTLEKFDSVAGCGSTAATPNVQGFWNTIAAANRRFPFAGWETFRGTTTGCAQTHVDQYRSVVTFNLASVASLKGLVQKAELVVETRVVPPAAGPGGAVTAGPFGVAGSVTLFCPSNIGGAGSLVRFGPSAPVPSTTPQGSLQELGANPFPAGSGTVYTLPPSFTTGPIPNATNPTTVMASGTGGATIATDVTSQINAALNGNFSSISWMLTSNFEGPLPGQLPTAATIDCRTSYDFDLRITHL
jgi:hypothetical protein